MVKELVRRAASVLSVAMATYLLLSFPPSNAYLRVQLNHSDYSDIFFFFWSAPLSLTLNNGNKNNKNLWKTFFMSVWSDSLYQAAKQAGCGFLCD